MTWTLAHPETVSQPAVVLGFDLLSSNLPLDVAWPVLVANAVAWLTGPPAAVPVPAGAEIELPVPPGVEGLEVVPPSGDPIRLDAANPRLRLDQVGVWRPRHVGPAEAVAALPPLDPIAVNAVPEEGDLSREPPTDVPGTGQGGGASQARDGRDVVGPGILAGVLALLCAEWAHSHGIRPLALLRRRRAQRIARVRQRV